MDIIQEYTPQLLSLLLQIEASTRPLRAILTDLQSRALTYLYPYLNTAARLAYDSPSIVSVGIFIILLLIILQIISVFKRIMMFWVGLLYKVVFWSLVVGLVAVVMRRGVGRTADDVGRWGGQLVGVWMREYEKWEKLDREKARGGYGNGRGRGNRRGWGS